MALDNEVDYYYHESAWRTAFEGNNSEVVIATDGSVYKDSISPANLVVNASGQVGPAGAVSAVAGGVVLRVGGGGTWDTFMEDGTIPDGLKAFEMPKTTNDDGLGGTIRYYYSRLAWKTAFNGQSDDIILTADGSVWKGSIDRENLVVDGFGNIGPAGGVAIAPEYTAGDVIYYYHREAWEFALDGTSAVVVVADDGSVYKGSMTEANLIVSALGTIGLAGGNASYVAPAGDFPSGAAVGDYYKISAPGTLGLFDLEVDDKILLESIGPDVWARTPAPFVFGGGQVKFYYNREAFRYAFEGTNSDLIITKDASPGGVYIGSILQENLVINNDGLLGPAGVDTSNSAYYNQGAIANQLERLFAYLHQTAQSANLNDAVGKELDWWGGILRLPRHKGEDDGIYRNRMLVITGPDKHTPPAIRAGLEKFVTPVSITEFGLESAYYGVSYYGYYQDREDPIVRTAIIGAQNVATINIVLPNDAKLDSLTFRQIIAEVTRALVLPGIKYSLVITS